jgi:histidinol-phosphate/aromatic aminotransferase/cobyric acid decarboxylase-like protein
MNYEGSGDGLRITVGADAEADRLLEELAGLV